MTAEVPPALEDAVAIGLRYVRPDEPGLRRMRDGDAFVYEDPAGERVADDETLGRIRSLAIPPAWTEVWICRDANGHLQAVGRDTKGRRQYRYHPRFRARRDTGKFERLVRFGDALPRIRRRVAKDLARRGLPREKVLAAVVALLETTRFRVGNAEYARVNKSFGISTLRTRHAKVSGSTVRFRFRGKGGRTEEGSLVDRRLATIIRRCQDLPGQELFQFIDDDGTSRPISSDDVNAYIREAAGSDEFSAKDFRTWTATVLAHRALREALEGGDLDTAATGGLPKRIVANALKQTAEAIGDTVTVTKTSYVHPAVLEPPPEVAEALATPSRPASTIRRRVNAITPDRRDELAVLRVLRWTGRQPRTTAGSRPARRSQARQRSAPGRSTRPAA